MTVMEPRAPTERSRPPRSPRRSPRRACSSRPRALAVDTRARKAASDGGARGATLPGVTEDMLARLMAWTSRRWRRAAARVAELLSAAREAHVTCPRGTDLTLDLRGRAGSPTTAT